MNNETSAVLLSLDILIIILSSVSLIMGILNCEWVHCYYDLFLPFVPRSARKVIVIIASLLMIIIGILNVLCEIF